VTSPPTSGSPDRAVRTWWPDAPGTVREVRFAHSPGRCDPAKLSHLPRFLQVAETSGAFRAGAFDAVRGRSDLVAAPRPRGSRWRTPACGSR